MKSRGETERRDGTGIPDDQLAYLYSGIPFLLRRADQRSVTLFNEAARDQGLTLGQFHLLFILDRIGTMSQVDLAAIAAIDTSTASLVIGTLVERGWIERRTDPEDRRRKQLAIAPEGTRRVAIALPAFAAALEELSGPLGADQERLLALLEKMVRAADGPPPQMVDGPSAATLAMIQHSSHFLIRRCLQIVEGRVSKKLDPTTLTLRQYALLLVIGLDEGVGETSIAQTLGLELSNTTFVVRLLAEKGLVAVDTGARRRRYRVTEAAIALFCSAEPAVAGALQECMAPLAPDERRDVLQLLGRVVLGDGTTGPPAFARICARPDWPVALSSNGFASMFKRESQPSSDAAERLAEMLAATARQVATPDGLARLSSFSPAKRTALTRLLRPLLTDDESETARARGAHPKISEPTNASGQRQIRERKK